MLTAKRPLLIWSRGVVCVYRSSSEGSSLMVQYRPSDEHARRVGAFDAGQRGSRKKERKNEKTGGAERSEKRGECATCTASQSAISPSLVDFGSGRLISRLLPDWRSSCPAVFLIPSGSNPPSDFFVLMVSYLKLLEIFLPRHNSIIVIWH